MCVGKGEVGDTVKTHSCGQCELSQYDHCCCHVNHRWIPAEVCECVCVLVHNRHQRHSQSNIRGDESKENTRECRWEDKVMFDWVKVVEMSRSGASIWFKLGKNINNSSTFISMEALWEWRGSFNNTEKWNDTLCYRSVSYIREKVEIVKVELREVKCDLSV